MSKIALILAVALALPACSHLGTYTYEGPANFKVTFNAESRMLAANEMYVGIYRFLPECKFEELGVKEIKNHEPTTLSLPVGDDLGIAAVFGAHSLLGSYASGTTSVMRMIPKKGETYELEIVDSAGSNGVEFYRVTSAGRKELESIKEKTCTERKFVR